MPGWYGSRLFGDWVVETGYGPGPQDYEHLRYAIQETSTPTVYPVCLSEVKQHLRMEHIVEQDAYLSELIKLGTRQLELDTRRIFISRTMKESYDWWPVSYTSPMELKRAPVSAITSITYIDTSQVEQTWDSANYVLDNRREPIRLHLAYGATIPTALDIENAIAITYTAGYGADGSYVPELAKHAIKLYVEWHYDRCEGAMKAYRELVTALLYGYM